MIQALLRHERLRRRPEFLKVQQNGVRTRGRYLTLFILPNNLDVSRLGIVATRRHGGAIRRNRVKRLVREIFRCNKCRPGLDIVVLPRPGCLDVSLLTLESDYRAVFRRYEQTSN